MRRTSLPKMFENTGHLVGGLFVDDTDHIHFDMRTIETTLEAHIKLQESVINWGKLLIAMGGALKPAKCSYYLISFKWKSDGTWNYDVSHLERYRTNVLLAHLTKVRR
jgi:hypothetical protein